MSHLLEILNSYLSVQTPRLGAAGSGNGGEAAAGGGVFRETSKMTNFDPGRHWGGGSGGSNGGEGENQRG